MQENRATELLSKHRAALDAVAEELLERETIDGADVVRLVQASLGETPGPETAPAGTETAAVD
jgi:ATP-dependent Zn protease